MPQTTHDQPQPAAGLLINRGLLQRQAGQLMRVRLADLTRDRQSRPLSPYLSTPKLPELLADDLRSAIAPPFIELAPRCAAAKIRCILAVSRSGKRVNVGIGPLLVV